MRRRAPCGSWASPISAARVAAGQISLAEPRFDAGDLCWLEGRPSEDGRSALMCRPMKGDIVELLPSWNVRTRVHEYGGGAWVRSRGTVFFSDFGSQRLFVEEPGNALRPITPEAPSPGSMRYADIDVSPEGDWIVCVREQHKSLHTVVNDIVILPADGSLAPRSLVCGHDFFAFPRISPNGRWLAWTSWDHPRMPWVGTDLWVAEIVGGELGSPRHVAGGVGESVFQPEWVSSDALCFISDRTRWGNLYVWHVADTHAGMPVFPMEAEFGRPQWVFGLRRYAPVGDERLLVTWSRDGYDHVGVLDTRRNQLETWDVGYSAVSAVASDGLDTVALVGGSPTGGFELAVGRLGSELEVLRRTIDVPPDAAFVSVPRHIEFTTSGGASAFAFFYAPKHPEFLPAEGEKPPLIVTSHGGPTSSATCVLALAVQFWTSRGFAVIDVDYRGSTGYGRDYTESLEGEWGRADVEDCIQAARHLARLGDVDEARMVIRGQSASGLTALSALVFHDAFSAGASYYGVGDLEGLARDTHKFESRYLDTLIGPYPKRADLYRERSPLAHAEQLRTPVIFFQGMQDVVVPPSQAEALVEVLRRKGVPYAYLKFQNEHHGFRQADTIRRCLEAELYFYSRTLGFDPADELEPVVIENV